MHVRTRAVLLAAVSIVTTTLSAQQTQGSIAMAAGSATDVTGTSSSAITLSPSITTTAPDRVFALSATGTRFSNRAWSAGLASAFSARGGAAAIAPTLDLAASGALTSYSFSYFTGDATPAIEARLGRARLFAGAHVSAASASGTIQVQPGSPLGGATPLTQTNATTNSGVAATGGASVAVSDDNGESLELAYRGERGVVAGTNQTDNLLSASIASDRVTLSASIGARAIPGSTVTFGNAGLAIALTSDAAMQIAAGRYPSNRLLGTAGGQFVNAGLMLRLGRASASLPRPAGVAPLSRGMTRLSIRADDATTVEVAGEFNHWDFVPTLHARNGVWYVDLRIPPGQYRYAFRINGKEWRIPAGVSAAEDEFGGKSAWLTVTPTVGGPK